MNAMIDKVFSFFRRYKKLLKLIDRETTMKTVLKSVAGALILSLICIAIPVLVVVNMFIYTKLTFILSVFLVIIVMGWSFLYYFFYYRLLKSYHEKINNINTLLPQLTESILVSIFFLVVGIVVLAVIF
ncbi:MAG: hypothetical protein NUK62_02210 [Tenericutes bacterium]|jgi:hypothetical protein|nr:hypothetical protein [Mycoplasmatota bacterium]